MATQKEIKEAHEQAVVESFLDWYNANNDSSFEIAETPDPPDAIVYDDTDDKTTWVEVVTIYLSNDEDSTFAKNLWILARTGEEHGSGGPFFNMDKSFAISFNENVSAKLSKNSYREVTEKYGQGILVVDVQNPLFDNQTIEAMEEEEDFDIDDSDYFHSIYIRWRGGGEYQFMEWE